MDAMLPNELELMLMPPRTEDGKLKALANLRRGRPSNGGKPESALQKKLKAIGLSGKVQESAESLLAVIQGDGLTHIREADMVSVSLLAEVLNAINLVSTDIRRYGLFREDGTTREAAKLLPRYVSEASALADKLGLSPSGRAKLGLAQGQALTLAEALAELDDHEEVNSGA